MKLYRGTLPCLIPNAIVFLFVLLPLTAMGAALGGWKFSWSDEFNGNSIDTSVWGYESGYSIRNQELENYTNRPENSRIDNGNLLIQALRDNFSGHPYSSASRRTMNKKSWLYGRFEMRAKIDVRLGSWPAWWWLPNSGGWPKGGEIDMMEFYQGKCLFNVMDGNQKWTSPTKTVTSLGGTTWADQFHVWTWEWDSVKIDLSLDGVLMNHYLVSNANGTGPSGGNPFKRPGYMLVNQAIGGINGGDPSATTFPVEYRIDWVRVHTWSNDSAYMLTVNSGVGSGPYVSGTTASITAKMPPSGQAFDKWTIGSGGPSIDNVASPSAILTMPASEATVTATYKSTSIVSSPQSLLMRIGQMHLNKNVVVYDISGRKISSFKAIPLHGQSGIPSGVYFIRQNDKMLQRVALQK